MYACPGSLTCLMSLLTILVFPQFAHGASKESKEKAAKRACLAGDYTKGVSILSDLYAQSNDPNYIYNGGRCFEQNGRYEEAILRFREYLRKAKPANTQERADAERHIADCQSLMEKRDGNAVVAPVPPERVSPLPAVPVATPPAPSDVVPAPPVATVAPPTETEIARPSPPSAAGAGLRTGGIVAMVAGGAGLIAGVTLNIKANSLAHELETTTDNYQRSKESTRANYVTFGWVSYGVGAACALSGGILYYVGRTRGAETSSVAMFPALGPGQVGAVVKGAF
jgi:tetratricopeptide (TPR) repeat protein